MTRASRNRTTDTVQEEPAVMGTSNNEDTNADGESNDNSVKMNDSVTHLHKHESESESDGADKRKPSEVDDMQNETEEGNKNENDQEGQQNHPIEGDMTDECNDSKTTPTVISQTSPPIESGTPVTSTEGRDADDQDNEEGGDDDDDKWDLKHIFTIEEIKKSDSQKCMTEDCPLIACATYVSSSGETWHSCLDCQENDYGGWPEKASEFPIKFMTDEHREVIAEKCTGSYTPVMPSVLPSKENENVKEKLGCPSTIANGTKNIKTDAATVTPPSSATKKKNTISNQSQLKSTVSVPPKPSKAALAIHQKWQADAKKLGGDRIIVSKLEAKKKIFSLLKDSFRPMNITEIYQVSGRFKSISFFGTSI